jgi:hypothetical protein
MSQDNITAGEKYGVWSIIAVVGLIAVSVMMVGMILYTIYVVGPANEAMFDTYKKSISNTDCVELKRMLYERDIPNKGGYFAATEHEYKWRCHLP